MMSIVLRSRVNRVREFVARLRQPCAKVGLCPCPMFLTSFSVSLVVPSSSPLPSNIESALASIRALVSSMGNHFASKVAHCGRSFPPVM